MGSNQGGTVTNSYATGAVTRSSGTDTRVGGLLGSSSGTVTARYYNTTTSGCVSGSTTGCTTSAGGTGQTTTQLQTPTDYTGIYATWNIDINNFDGDNDATTSMDYPWLFGTASQYPTLQYGKQGEHDVVDDNYIDIETLAQLNAIRYDLNGDGTQGTVSATNWANYSAAFANYGSGMGCDSTCVGYELFVDLNFDENGDGQITQTGDPAYWNAGSGWLPIGTSSDGYTGDFKGNGHAINGLYIDRASSTHNGLFGANSSSSRIETLGITRANVTGHNYSGILIGSNDGEIIACYTTGQVSAGSNDWVGGLAGHNGRVVHSSYSTASVTGDRYVGGLIGHSVGVGSAVVTNSYSAGAVTGNTDVGGLIGNSTSGTSAASYWHTTTSGQTSSAAGTGYATADLQRPTDYTGIYAAWNATLRVSAPYPSRCPPLPGIYAAWNANIDGSPGNYAPWSFGTSSQYPALKYGGQNIYTQGQGNDYDADNDGYIDVANLAQLSAIRHDLNTNGVPTSGGTTAYNAAFPNRSPYSNTRMGCPSGNCVGYELVASLYFDADGDGDVDNDDNGGAYNNWSPIGTFAGKFKGNGHTINNLRINRPSNSTLDQGLFGQVNGSGARIETLGVTNVDIIGYSGNGTVAGRILNGAIVACYSSGNIDGNFHVGGIVGILNGASSTVRYSYSIAFVEGGINIGGLVGRMFNNASVTNSYATGAVQAFSGNPGGLVGAASFGATSTNSYWDTQPGNCARWRSTSGRYVKQY